MIALIITNSYTLLAPVNWLIGANNGLIIEPLTK